MVWILTPVFHTCRCWQCKCVILLFKEHSVLGYAVYNFVSISYFLEIWIAVNSKKQVELLTSFILNYQKNCYSAVCTNINICTLHIQRFAIWSTLVLIYLVLFSFIQILIPLALLQILMFVHLIYRGLSFDLLVLIYLVFFSACIQDGDVIMGCMYCSF